MQDLTNTLGRLRDASVKLSQLSTELGNYVASVEAYLGECGIGVPVVVDAGDDIQLAYCRIGSQYRIAVVSAEAITAWPDCAPEIKLKTIALLPKLLAQIEVAVVQSAAALAETLEQLARSFPQPANPPKPTAKSQKTSPTSPPSAKTKPQVVDRMVITPSRSPDPKSTRLGDIPKKAG